MDRVIVSPHSAASSASPWPSPDRCGFRQCCMCRSSSTGIVLVAFLFSAMAGVIFGYFPALKAARLDHI